MVVVRVADPLVDRDIELVGAFDEIQALDVEYRFLVPDQLIRDEEAIFHIESLDLIEGTYKLDVAVHKRDGYPYDYHRLLYTFRVKSRTHDVGIYRPRHRWTFSPGVQFRAKDRDSL